MAKLYFTKDIQPKLSAGGVNRDVENTTNKQTRCTRPNCILAPKSHPRLCRLWASVDLVMMIVMLMTVMLTKVILTKVMLTMVWNMMMWESLVRGGCNCNARAASLGDPQVSPDVPTLEYQCHPC